MEQLEYARMYQEEDTHWWFVSRRHLAAAILEQWHVSDSPGRILDVGCGTGGNLEFLSSWGETWGIDLSALALDFARRRRLSRLACASALNLPYPDHAFGLVTAFDVFYHRWIVDDSRAILECYRVLRPGGWLLLTDSALPGLWSPHDELYHARQRYTLSDICQKLAQIGFDISMCSYTRTLLLPLFIGSRLAMRWLPVSPDLDLKPPPAWLNQLLISIHHLEGLWLSRGGTLPAGSSLVCLVQKPELDVHHETS